MRRLVPVLLLVLAPSAAVATAAASDIDESQPTGVELLDRGAAPRERLRYDLVLGREQDVQVSSFDRLSFTVDGGLAQTAATAELAFDLHTTVIGADDGAVDLAILYSPVPPADGELPRELFSVNGLVVNLELDDRGEVLGTLVAPAEEVTPELKPLVEQIEDQAESLVTPFPAEAIGIGARWSATTQHALDGIQFEQTVVFELVSKDGNRIKIDTDLRQSATPQTFLNASTGAPVQLLSWTATGEGASTLRLDRIMALRGETRLRVRQELDSGETTVSQMRRSRLLIGPSDF